MTLATLDGTSSSDLLKSDGPFSKTIEGFQSRPIQQQLASTIESVIRQKSCLVAEAGTGIGKTFSYLVPAIRSGQSIIISTGTKNLQDQLFYKDIPLVCDSLGSRPKLALLKGRNNYLCSYRLDMVLSEGRLSSRQAIHDLQLIKLWSSTTKIGDLAELVDLSDNSEIRQHVTSTADNCLGQDCPDFEDCYLQKARKKAQQAKIVVINHHLLCADMVLKEDGFAELLPAADVVIVDEAHKLPDTVSQFFGRSISSRQISELATDMRREYLTEAKDCADLELMANNIEQSIKTLRLAMGEQSQRVAWDRFKNLPDIVQAVNELKEYFETLEDLLEPLHQRSKGLESCLNRTIALAETLKSLTKDNEGEMIHWCETWSRSFQIHQTPVDISKSFQSKWKNHGGSWIFTSATLAVGNTLDHYINTLGLSDCESLLLNSPFNYKEQALMYLPRGLPDPSSPTHSEQLMQTVLPILRASKGRAFCLFTSYKALQDASTWLSKNGQFKLMIQGTADKTELLKRFRSTKKAVLMATSSFWEGIDVRGSELCCVIIDKLPFAVPSDPVLQARISACRKAGGNAFSDIQLPAAVISLKQGAGRLIRDHSDRGVLVIGDPRLISKNYGEQFIKSLPQMYKTRDLELVKGFLGEIP